MEIAIGSGKSVLKREQGWDVGKAGIPKLKKDVPDSIHKAASGILRYPKAPQIPHNAH